MPKRAIHDEDSESRTSALGSKRQRRRKGQVQATPSLSSRSSISSHKSALDDVSKSLPGLSVATSPAAMAPDQSFGLNRLATGFRPAPLPTTLPNELGVDAHTSRIETQDVIEISDDEDGEDEEKQKPQEETDDDGGMLINVDGSPRQSHPVDMDIEQSEEGEASSQENLTSQPRTSQGKPSQLPSSTGSKAHIQLQDGLTSFGTEKYPVPRLADQNREDLAEQLKYAYFDIDPQTIDLNRPAACLDCLQTTHVARDCPELICPLCSGSHSPRLCPQISRCSKCRQRGHDSDSCPSGLKVTTTPCDICGVLGHVETACAKRFFPEEASNPSRSLRLWISCCVCTSNDHLVGDCPRANSATTARWSLKSFPPGAVFNLSTRKDMKALEHAAANRGLRPEGLQIKGRANLHHTGGPISARKQDDDDDDDEFIRPPVQSRGAAKSGPPQKQTEAKVEPVGIPSRPILRAFMDAANAARRREGKSTIGWNYRGADPHFFDLAFQDKRISFDNIEQKHIVWTWHKNGRRDTRSFGTKRRPAFRIGDPYLVWEKKEIRGRDPSMR